MRVKAGIIGGGSWGTTLALLLYDNGHEVKIWFRREGYAREVSRRRENYIYLPGIKIPDEITITWEIERIFDDSELIILAVPTQYLRDIIRAVDLSRVDGKFFVNVAKGIETSTLMRISEIVRDVLKVDIEQYCVLSGPSHAEEVSRKMPTAVVTASVNRELRNIVQKVFMNRYFRVYASDDVRGVELGGALKNVIAIATGIADGVGFGDNTRAAIMTRGIVEITRLGVNMGAKVETFSGLSGIGDLIVTCMSRYSRNRYVGEQIGRGKKLGEVLKGMAMVAEGVWTTKSARELACRFDVEMPITNEVYEVLFKDKSPLKATSDLMSRSAKPEMWGIEKLR
jgi:glycerol-3-phosphate dehydrogenase (NAD(P)+)